jgi:hypothetical protein
MRTSHVAPVTCPVSPLAARCFPRAICVRPLDRRARFWDAWRMPWAPELFTAPALQQLQDARRVDARSRVPYLDGFLTGEPEALIGSFAGEPVVHDPIRGRIRGEAAFRAFFTQMHGWLRDRHVAVEDVLHVPVGHGGFEEVVVHLDGPGGRIALPFATVTELSGDGRIEELRAYHGTRALTGRRAPRSPLLQPDPGLRGPDAVAEYQRGLAAGDVDAVVAAFEADGYVRDASGAEPRHRGPEALRRYYGALLAPGGIVLADCAVGQAGDACAVEYDVVGWGGADVLPQAGMAVFIGGAGGGLAAVRIYHDLAPDD